MVHHRRQLLWEHRSAPFVNYYVNQAHGKIQRGSGLPAFGGVRMQRGHGIGNFFGSLFGKIKSALPWFFKTVAKNALQTGANVAGDMLEGKQFKESIKERGLRAAKDTAGEIGPKALEGIKSSAGQLFSQSGSGRAKKTRISKKRKYRDIFG
jgi:hypothetical protein